MKHVLLPALAILLLSSCGNDAKIKSVQTSDDGTTTTTTYDMSNLEKIAQKSDEMQEKMEDLKKLQPLSLEQLKALLPEEINAMKRSRYNTSSTMGYSLAEGDYEQDENTRLKVMIYDCAGESGAAMYSLTYWGAMNFQQDSEKEYTKTVDFKGAKAIENYKKDQNESSLTYVTSDRLLVVLTGQNMKPEALKEAASQLNTNL